MSDDAGAHHEEEPQEQRGAKGSRDTGSDQPAGGPADRPEGQVTDQSDTSATPSEPDDPDSPELQPGGGH